MPSNVFGNGDAFALETLTSIINDQYKQSVLSNSNLFVEKGIPTTKMFIEMVNGLITLVQSSPRGAPGQPHRTPKRNGRELEAVHLKTTGAVLADSVQGVRAFGSSTDLNNVPQIRDAALAGMQSNLEATNEWLRMGAIKGQILDADGVTVLLDLFAFFGISQQTLTVDLSNPAVDVPQAIVAAKRLSEDALGMTKPTGWLAYADDQFLDRLRHHASIRETLAGWNAAVAMRADVRDNFAVGDVRFQELRDAFGLPFVEPDTAYLIPLGVEGLLQTAFAPADWTETVNTNGYPYYAKAERMSFDRGFELEAQSNPIHWCSRPRAIVRINAT